MYTRHSLKKHCTHTAVLVSLLLFSFSLSANCDRSLLNGWSGEWEPFVLGSYDKPSGLDMEVLDAVVSAAGCTWENTKIEIPWPRHLLLIKAGQLDLATGASWTKERAKYAHFTKPYRNEQAAIFVNKSDFMKYEHLSLKELADTDLTIGAVIGEFYGNDIESLLLQIGDNVQRVNDQNLNMPKLKAKRLDGFIGFLPFESIRLKKEGNNNDIVLLSNTITNTGDIHIMLSKFANSDRIFQKITTGLDKIIENGTYDKIIQKYKNKYELSY